MDCKNCVSLTSLDYVRFSEGGMHRAKLVKQEIFSPSCLLGPHLQYMEVPRLGVKSELQLLTYATGSELPL